MMRVLLVSVLLFGFIYSSPVQSEAEEEPAKVVDRGLIEDLITGMIEQQIYNILSGLGIVPTTTTTCGPLGLLCGGPDHGDGQSANLQHSLWAGHCTHYNYHMWTSGVTLWIELRNFLLLTRKIIYHFLVY